MENLDKCVVWFGRIEFGDFSKGRDCFPIALVKEIQEQQLMAAGEADDYMVEHHYDGYLIPSIFEGEIYFEGGAEL